MKGQSNEERKNDTKKGNRLKEKQKGREEGKIK
jgi:hypothetical protein